MKAENNKSDRKCKTNTSILLTNIALCFFASLVDVSGAGSANAQGFGANVSKRPAMESEVLKEKTPIKNLPDYTGKAKFFSGNTLKTSIGPQYQQQFIAMETPGQVIDWYKSALSSYKWEVQSSEENAVTGKMADGARISIIVNPYHRPDGRSMVTINYNDYHLDHQADPAE